MSIEKISEAEFKRASVSSLPTRPNSGSLYGGASLSPTELKNAFDKAPALIMAKLNELIDSITSVADSDGHISGQLLTGLADGHTLKNLFEDIVSGELSKYLYVENDTLYGKIHAVEDRQGSAISSITYDVANNRIAYKSLDGVEYSFSLGKGGINDYVEEKKLEIDSFIDENLNGFRYVDFEGADATFCIEADTECALTNFSSLDIATPPSVEPGFCSIVHLTVSDSSNIYIPAWANTYTQSQGVTEKEIVYLGDDVSSGAVSLCDGYRYTLFFIHDGEALTCTVNRRVA